MNETEYARESHIRQCAETRSRLASKGFEGPWMDEPDRVEFKAHGLDCLMVRQAESFHWCGYVAVPPSHPLHGKGWSDTEGQLEAHGGITYGRPCEGAVCHAALPGEPDDVWWIGFDCAHSGDLSPGQLGISFMTSQWDPVYRDHDYVKSEVEALAKQLADRATHGQAH